jgi:hypothetical protein
MVYKTTDCSNNISGEPWIHLLSKAQSEQLQQFSCNRYDQRCVFENGQEGIIAIDIQDGYDKFNDNVKYFRQLSRPKHYYKRRCLYF